MRMGNVDHLFLFSLPFKAKMKYSAVATQVYFILFQGESEIDFKND